MTKTSAATDRIATAVGWIAIEAARVELVAAQLAAAMIGTPRAMPVVVGHPWAATKDAVEALIRERIDHADASAEGRAEIELLEITRTSIRHADEHMKQRANVVHALWDIPLRSELAWVSLKRWGGYRRGDWSLTDLERLHADLCAAADELGRHFEREAARAG